LRSRTIARDYSATRRNLETRVLKVVEIIRVYPIPPANYDLEIVRRRDGGRARLCCRPRLPLARWQAIFTCVRVIFNEHAKRPLRNAERRRQLLVLFFFLLRVNLPCAWSKHRAASHRFYFLSRADVTGFFFAFASCCSSCSRSCVPLLPSGAYRNNPMRLRPALMPWRRLIIIGHVFTISSRGVP